MLAILTDPLFSRFWLLLMAALLATVTTIVARKWLGDKYSGTPDRAENVKEDLAEFCNKIVIVVLLPLLFTEAVAENADKWAEILLGVVLGAAFALLTYLLGHAALPKSDKYVNPWSDIVGSTFGGGNRGAVLLLIVATLWALDANRYLSYFYAIDLGNFLVFLYILPFFIKKKANAENKTDAPGGMKGLMSYVGLPYLFIAIIFGLSAMSDAVRQFALALLSGSSDERSFLLLFLALTGIGLMLTRKVSWSSALSSLSFMFAARIVALLPLAIFVVYSNNIANAKEFLSNPFALGLLVLLLCPPSSLIPARIAHYVDDRTTREFVSTISAIWMLLYAALIAILVGTYSLHALFG